MKRPVLIGFLAAFVLISWLAWYCYDRGAEILSDENRIARVNHALIQCDQVLHRVSALGASPKDERIPDFAGGAGRILDDYQRALPELKAGLPLQETNLEQLSGYLREVRDGSTAPERAALRDSIHSLVLQIRTGANYQVALVTDGREKKIQELKVAFAGLLTTTALTLLLFLRMLVLEGRRRSSSERDLARLKTENEDLYDNAPCGYHAIDGQGVFTAMNKTMLRWLGYGKDEVIGKLKFSDILDPKDLSFYDRNFSLFRERGFLYNLEFRLISKTGEPVPVIMNAVATEDSQGKFLRSRSSTLNNTALVEAQEKITHLNHELEAFSYSVSHDLRAPLRSIDGYSRILMEDYSEKLDDEGKRVLKVIINNARRMGKLIDDLLDFGRLGRKDLQPTVIRMTDMVKNILRDLQAEHRDRDLEFHVNELHSVSADMEMIRRVWVNLLENAVKYTGKKEKAVIRISSCDRAPGEVCFKVEDNGVGFDMKYVSKLFGVFQRLHKIQDFSGTGVGLAIVKRIVNRHNGRVWAEGVPCEGASFYFTIPTTNGNK